MRPPSIPTVVFRGSINKNKDLSRNDMNKALHLVSTPIQNNQSLVDNKKQCPSRPKSSSSCSTRDSKKKQNIIQSDLTLNRNFHKKAKSNNKINPIKGSSFPTSSTSENDHCEYIYNQIWACKRRFSFSTDVLIGNPTNKDDTSIVVKDWPDDLLSNWNSTLQISIDDNFNNGLTVESVIKEFQQEKSLKDKTLALSSKNKIINKNIKNSKSKRSLTKNLKVNEKRSFNYLKKSIGNHSNDKNIDKKSAPSYNINRHISNKNNGIKKIEDYKGVSNTSCRHNNESSIKSNFNHKDHLASQDKSITENGTSKNESIPPKTNTARLKSESEQNSAYIVDVSQCSREVEKSSHIIVMNEEKMSNLVDSNLSHINNNISKIDGNQKNVFIPSESNLKTVNDNKLSFDLSKSSDQKNILNDSKMKLPVEVKQNLTSDKGTITQNSFVSDSNSKKTPNVKINSTDENIPSQSLIATHQNSVTTFENKQKLVLSPESDLCKASPFNHNTNLTDKVPDKQFNQQKIPLNDTSKETPLSNQELKFILEELSDLGVKNQVVQSFNNIEPSSSSNLKSTSNFGSSKNVAPTDKSSEVKSVSNYSPSGSVGNIIPPFNSKPVSDFTPLENISSSTTDLKTSDVKPKDNSKSFIPNSKSKGMKSVSIASSSVYFVTNNLPSDTKSGDNIAPCTNITPSITSDVNLDSNLPPSKCIPPTTSPSNPKSISNSSPFENILPNNSPSNLKSVSNLSPSENIAPNNSLSNVNPGSIASPSENIASTASPSNLKSNLNFPPLDNIAPNLSLDVKSSNFTPSKMISPTLASNLKSVSNSESSSKALPDSNTNSCASAIFPPSSNSKVNVTAKERTSSVPLYNLKITSPEKDSSKSSGGDAVKKIRDTDDYNSCLLSSHYLKKVASQLKELEFVKSNEEKQSKTDNLSTSSSNLESKTRLRNFGQESKAKTLTAKQNMQEFMNKKFYCIPNFETDIFIPDVGYSTYTEKTVPFVEKSLPKNDLKLSNIGKDLTKESDDAKLISSPVKDLPKEPSFVAKAVSTTDKGILKESFPDDAKDVSNSFKGLLKESPDAGSTSVNSPSEKPPQNAKAVSSDNGLLKESSHVAKAATSSVYSLLKESSLDAKPAPISINGVSKESSLDGKAAPSVNSLLKKSSDVAKASATSVYGLLKESSLDGKAAPSVTSLPKESSDVAKAGATSVYGLLKESSLNEKPAPISINGLSKESSLNEKAAPSDNGLLKDSSHFAKAGVTSVYGLLKESSLDGKAAPSVNSLPKESSHVAKAGATSVYGLLKESSLDAKAAPISDNGLPKESSFVVNASTTSFNGLPKESSLDVKAAPTSSNGLPKESSPVAKDGATSVNGPLKESSLDAKAAQISINGLPKESSFVVKAVATLFDGLPKESSLDTKADPNSINGLPKESSHAAKACATSAPDFLKEPKLEAKGVFLFKGLPKESSFEAKAVSSSDKGLLKQSSVEAKAVNTSVKGLSKESFLYDAKAVSPSVKDLTKEISINRLNVNDKILSTSYKYDQESDTSLMNPLKNHDKIPEKEPPLLKKINDKFPDKKLNISGHEGNLNNSIYEKSLPFNFVATSNSAEVLFSKHSTKNESFNKENKPQKICEEDPIEIDDKNSSSNFLKEICIFESREKDRDKDSAIRNKDESFKNFSKKVNTFKKIVGVESSSTKDNCYEEVVPMKFSFSLKSENSMSGAPVKSSFLKKDHASESVEPLKFTFALEKKDVSSANHPSNELKSVSTLEKIEKGKMQLSDTSAVSMSKESKINSAPEDTNAVNLGKIMPNQDNFLKKSSPSTNFQHHSLKDSEKIVSDINDPAVSHIPQKYFPSGNLHVFSPFVKESLTGSTLFPTDLVNQASTSGERDSSEVIKKTINHHHVFDDKVAVSTFEEKLLKKSQKSVQPKKRSLFTGRLRDDYSSNKDPFTRKIPPLTELSCLNSDKSSQNNQKPLNYFDTKILKKSSTEKGNQTADVNKSQNILKATKIDHSTKSSLNPGMVYNNVPNIRKENFEKIYSSDQKSFEFKEGSTLVPTLDDIKPSSQKPNHYIFNNENNLKNVITSETVSNTQKPFQKFLDFGSSDFIFNPESGKNEVWSHSENVNKFPSYDSVNNKTISNNSSSNACQNSINTKHSLWDCETSENINEKKPDLLRHEANSISLDEEVRFIPGDKINFNNTQTVYKEKFNEGKNRLNFEGKSFPVTSSKSKILPNKYTVSPSNLKVKQNDSNETTISYKDWKMANVQNNKSSLDSGEKLFISDCSTKLNKTLSGRNRTSIGSKCEKNLNEPSKRIKGMSKKDSMKLLCQINNNSVDQNKKVSNTQEKFDQTNLSGLDLNKGNIRKLDKKNNIDKKHFLSPDSPQLSKENSLLSVWSESQISKSILRSKLKFENEKSKSNNEEVRKNKMNVIDSKESSKTLKNFQQTDSLLADDVPYFMSKSITGPLFEDCDPSNTKDQVRTVSCSNNLKKINSDTLTKDNGEKTEELNDIFDNPYHMSTCSLPDSSEKCNSGFISDTFNRELNLNEKNESKSSKSSSFPSISQTPTIKNKIPILNRIDLLRNLNNLNSQPAVENDFSYKKALINSFEKKISLSIELINSNSFSSNTSLDSTSRQKMSQSKINDESKTTPINDRNANAVLENEISMTKMTLPFVEKELKCKSLRMPLISQYQPTDFEKSNSRKFKSVNKLNEKETATVMKKYCRVRAKSNSFPSAYEVANSYIQKDLRHLLWKNSRISENTKISDTAKYRVRPISTKHREYCRVCCKSSGDMNSYRIRAQSIKYSKNSDSNQKYKKDQVNGNNNNQKESEVISGESGDASSKGANNEAEISPYFIDPNIWKYVLLFRGFPLHLKKDDKDVNDIKELPDVSKRSVLDLFRSVDKSAVIIQKDFYTREKIMNRIKDEKDKLKKPIKTDNVIKTQEVNPEMNLESNENSSVDSSVVFKEDHNVSETSYNYSSNIKTNEDPMTSSTQFKNDQIKNVVNSDGNISESQNEFNFLSYNSIFSKTVDLEQFGLYSDQNTTSSVTNSNIGKYQDKVISKSRNIFKNIVIFNSGPKSESAQVQEEEYKVDSSFNNNNNSVNASDKMDKDRTNVFDDAASNIRFKNDLSGNLESSSSGNVPKPEVNEEAIVDPVYSEHTIAKPALSDVDKPPLPHDSGLVVKSVSGQGEKQKIVQADHEHAVATVSADSKLMTDPTVEDINTNTDESKPSVLFVSPEHVDKKAEPEKVKISSIYEHAKSERNEFDRAKSASTRRNDITRRHENVETNSDKVTPSSTNASSTHDVGQKVLPEQAKNPATFEPIKPVYSDYGHVEPENGFSNRRAKPGAFKNIENNSDKLKVSPSSNASSKEAGDQNVLNEPVGGRPPSFKPAHSEHVPEKSISPPESAFKNYIDSSESKTDSPFDTSPENVDQRVVPEHIKKPSTFEHARYFDSDYDQVESVPTPERTVLKQTNKPTDSDGFNGNSDEPKPTVVYVFPGNKGDQRDVSEQFKQPATFEEDKHVHDKHNHVKITSITESAGTEHMSKQHLSNTNPENGSSEPVSKSVLPQKYNLDEELNQLYEHSKDSLLNESTVDIIKHPVDKRNSGNLLIKLKDDGSDSLAISSFDVSFYDDPSKSFSVLSSDDDLNIDIAALIKENNESNTKELTTKGGAKDLTTKDNNLVVKENRKNPSFPFPQSTSTTSINLRTIDSKIEVSVAQNSNTLDPGSSVPSVVKSYFQMSGCSAKLKDKVRIIEAAKKSLMGLGEVADVPINQISGIISGDSLNNNNNSNLKISSGAYSVVDSKKDNENGPTNAKREYELSSSSYSDDTKPIVTVSNDYPVINIQLQLAKKGLKPNGANDPHQEEVTPKIPPNSRHTDSYEDTIEKMRKKFISNSFRPDSSVAVNRLKPKGDEAKIPKNMHDIERESEEKKHKADSFEYDPNNNPLNEKDLKLLENYFYSKNNPNKKGGSNKAKKSSKYSLGKGNKGMGGKKPKLDPSSQVVDSVSKFKELIEKYANENYMELSQYTFSVVSPSEFANAPRPSSLNKVTPIADVSEHTIASFNILKREDREYAFNKPIQGIINIDLLANPILKEKFATVPSVSKILNDTMSDASKSALDKWKIRMIALMGEATFNQFYQAQLDQGKDFHESVKGQLMGRSDLIEKHKDNLCLKSIGWVLKDISDVAAVESFVVHPALGYKGIFDCVAKYKDKPVLIEWKHSSRKKSKLSSTYDAPLQMTAYMGALTEDRNYNFQVDSGLVVVAHADGSPAELFEVNVDDCQKFWTLWLKRLSHFVAGYKPKSTL